MVRLGRRRAGPPGYLRVRLCFLTEGDRTSGVAGTHEVLADTGEIPFRVFKFLSDTQTGELPQRLKMRPCDTPRAVIPRASPVRLVPE